MSTRLGPGAAASTVEYPDDDGNPMAENTLQFQWIVTIKEGLEALLRDRPDVFVAGDLLWYPVEGDNKTRTAPDAMVAFGRPKGYRGSYKQWEEGGVAPQVVFEVLSPGNRAGELLRKLRFYERFGVEEYYIYDPDRNTLAAYRREGGRLAKLPQPDGMTSPRLGVRFVLRDATLELIGPDGRRFQTYVELAQERDALSQQRDALSQQRDALSQQRDALARQRDEERLRADRLAERLRAMGIDPDEAGG